jgi:hypothetical protein
MPSLLWNLREDVRGKKKVEYAPFKRHSMDSIKRRRGQLCVLRLVSNG